MLLCCYVLCVCVLNQSRSWSFICYDDGSKPAYCHIGVCKSHQDSVVAYNYIYRMYRYLQKRTNICFSLVIAIYLLEMWSRGFKQWKYKDRLWNKITVVRKFIQMTLAIFRRNITDWTRVDQWFNNMWFWIITIRWSKFCFESVWFICCKMLATAT